MLAFLVMFMAVLKRGGRNSHDFLEIVLYVL